MHRRVALSIALAGLALPALAQRADRNSRQREAIGLPPGDARSLPGTEQQRLAREQPWRVAPGGSLPGRTPGTISGDTPGTLSGSLPGTTSGIAGSGR